MLLANTFGFDNVGLVALLEELGAACAEHYGGGAAFGCLHEAGVPPLVDEETVERLVEGLFYLVDVLRRGVAGHEKGEAEDEGGAEETGGVFEDMGCMFHGDGCFILIQMFSR